MKRKSPTIKTITAAATLIIAALALGTPALGEELPATAKKAFYRQQIQQQVEICQAKSALQFSRFENVRELGRIYGLKLAYLTRQQDQLVTQMAHKDVAAKTYRVSRFITADFHRTLDKYNLARR